MKAQLSKLRRVLGGTGSGGRRKPRTVTASGLVGAALLSVGAGLLAGCQTTPLLPAGPIVYYRQIGACNGTASLEAGPNAAYVLYQIDAIDNEGGVAFAFDPTKLSANTSPAVKTGTMPPVQIPLNINTTSPILSALNVSPAQDTTVAAGQQSVLPPTAGLVTLGTGAGDGAMEADRARYFLIYATPANDPPVLPTMLGLARTAWPYTPDCADLRPNRGQTAYVDNRGIQGTISTFRIDPTTGLLKDLGKPVPDTLVSNDISSGLLAVEPRGHFLFGIDSTANELLTFKIHADDGSLDPPNANAAPISDIAFAMAIDPAGRFLYVGEGSGIDAFRLDAVTGMPTNTGHIGSDQTYSLAVDGGGHFLYALASPFSGETLTAYAIDQSSGALSQVSSLPTNGDRGADSITISPLNGYLYLADRHSNAVRVFVFNATTLAFTEPVGPTAIPGGAVSLAFDGGGGFLYVVNGASGVSAFSISSTGALQPLAAPTSQFPNSIYAEPTGRFIYIQNDVQNLTTYRLNPITGVLTQLPGPPLSVTALMIPGTY